MGIPEVESIGPGVAVRDGGESIAAGAEDCVDLVASGEEPLGLLG